MKKKIAILATMALVTGLMPVTAFAHGHSKHSTATTTYSLCSVENCSTTGNHKHNGITYSGHYSGDGHDYHNCSSRGSHHR